MDLPLGSITPPGWAARALVDPLALLEDHAHLERKAAQNALALLSRWPGGEAADDDAVQAWTQTLAAVARDEVEHLGLVLRILRSRGRGLGRVHKNPYATALRGMVREGAGQAELLDRLLVSALIEARSCERFGCLAEAATDPELQRLYRGLLASERGHYRVFLDLARRLPGAGDVDGRWRELLAAEARILAAQPPGPRIHAGT